MNILVTGYSGFVGKNLLNFLELKKINVFKFGKKNSFWELDNIINEIDLIFHFAGENRSKYKNKFIENNQILTLGLVNFLNKRNLNIPLVFTSTIKYKDNTHYGKSKKKAEEILIKAFKKSKTSLDILRLPNIFGKWCKPNYNSVVSTFCYNISRNLKIQLSENNLSLYYIDDLIQFLFKKYVLNYENFKKRKKQRKISKFSPINKIKVSQLANKIKEFKFDRKNFFLPNIKNNFDKKLYSTYLTYIPSKNFSYKLNSHKDKRGLFCEVFKHEKIGQVSFLTINSYQTRGCHFHNTKVEKFLLIEGKCNFIFKDIESNRKKVITCSSKKLQIVEAIPGWIHKIYNTSKKKALVMIWTNEVFDVNNPDTYAKKI